ncbi:MAG: hypothetical protein ABI548_23180 [Polyangiaceae bacterium]
MSRGWSLALPAVTVLVVAYALLVAGVPRQVVGARVYGGPTEGLDSFSLRVEAVTRDGEHETPYWPGSLNVTASPANSAPLALVVTRATRGVADFRLGFARPIHGLLNFTVRDPSGSLLAVGPVTLGGERWAARARRRGSWIRGRDSGGLVLSIAAQRGAFVVGAADSLLIRVEHAGSGVSGARLTLSADGAELGIGQDLRTDAHGRAHVSFLAVALNPTLRIEARTDDQQTGLIDSGVPVVPGGFNGVRTATGVRIESATPRTEAFFSLVTDRARVTGGAVALTPDGRGGAWANVDMPAPPEPAWLVVSSEVDQNSVAAIGWPLTVGAEPAQTFDVPDTLLLDGLPGAFAREQARRSHVRWLTAVFIALAFALSVVTLVLRVRAADRDIAQHLRSDLEADTAERIAPRRFLPLLGALLVLGLGFVLLGLIVAARSH